MILFAVYICIHNMSFRNHGQNLPCQNVPRHGNLHGQIHGNVHGNVHANVGKGIHGRYFADRYFTQLIFANVLIYRCPLRVKYLVPVKICN